MGIKQFLMFGKKKKHNLPLQKFDDMSKKEKKDFLSNDLIERLIRVEQRVSAQFGKLVHYQDTLYYKSLSPKEKQSFENYLKNKGKVKVVVSFILFMPFLALFLFNINFTGNVIIENFGNSGYINYGLAGFLAVMFLVLAISWRIRKSRKKKFDSHFSILESIYYKKRFLK